MSLSRRAFRMCPAVRECQFLTVATSARFFPVQRHPFVVEQVAAKFDLGCTHRIAGRDGRTGKSLWEVPVEVRGARFRSSVCAGSRCFPPTTTRPINDRRIWPLYEAAAELGVPDDDPHGLELAPGGQVARPTTTPSTSRTRSSSSRRCGPILAHCGFAWSELVLMLMAKDPRRRRRSRLVVTVPATMAGGTDALDGKYLGVLDRIFWGTDYPFTRLRVGPGLLARRSPPSAGAWGSSPRSPTRTSRASSARTSLAFSASEVAPSATSRGLAPGRGPNCCQSVGQRPWISGVASKSACAARSTRPSCQAGAVNWTATGMPRASNPARTAQAGSPVRS